MESKRDGKEGGWRVVRRLIGQLAEAYAIGAERHLPSYMSLRLICHDVIASSYHVI